VLVDGVSSKALCDSGAQIPVISRRLFEQCSGDVIGSVCLQNVIGKSVDAPSVNLSVKLRRSKGIVQHISRYVYYLCHC